MAAIRFKEVQRFTTWWAWLAVIALNGLFIFAIVQQIILNIPFGNKPAPDYILMLIECFMLLLLLFLFSIRLQTSIDETGICYRFYPYQFKETTIAWHELRDAYMRDYNSFHEYGGYGIRYGSAKTGRAINTSASCNRGLQLQFNDGKLLLIGTKKPEEIETIIKKIIALGKINRAV